MKQYLLVGDTVLLLDTGVARTPVETIFPYLEKIGVAAVAHRDGDRAARR